MEINVEKLITLYSDSYIDGPSRELLKLDKSFLNYLIGVLNNLSVALPSASSEKWDKFFELLNKNRITPLFYWKLKDFNPKFQPPDHILTKLRENHLASCAKSIASRQQLEALFKIFSDEKIKVLAFKGCVYDRYLYPKTGLRPFNDFDFLIHPNDYNKFYDCMNRAGYKTSNLFAKLSEIMDEEQYTSIEVINHGSKIKHKGNTPIDLHWKLNVYPGIISNYNTNDLMGCSIEIDGIRTFNLIDSFINTIIHTLITHERAIKLISLFDALFLLQRIFESSQFSELIKKSEAICATPFVKKMLNLLRHWQLTPLKQEVLDEYKINLFTKREKRIAYLIFKRHNNIFYWLFIRFPRGLGFFKSIKIFISYSIYRLRQFMKI